MTGGRLSTVIERFATGLFLVKTSKGSASTSSYICISSPLSRFPTYVRSGIENDVAVHLRWHSLIPTVRPNEK